MSVRKPLRAWFIPITYGTNWWSTTHFLLDWQLAKLIGDWIGPVIRLNSNIFVFYTYSFLTPVDAEDSNIPHISALVPPEHIWEKCTLLRKHIYLDLMVSAGPGLLLYRVLQFACFRVCFIGLYPLQRSGYWLGPGCSDDTLVRLFWLCYFPMCFESVYRYPIL